MKVSGGLMDLGVLNLGLWKTTQIVGARGKWALHRIMSTTLEIIKIY